VRVQLGASTHVGQVRTVNEDAVLAEHHLVVVADGMGGHARGDLASACAIAEFRHLTREEFLTPADVERAVGAANQRILDEVAGAPELEGMGTTLTGVALVQYAGEPHWLVFNVGDSRVYRVTGAGAEQLTVDHSEVSELIALGRLTQDAASSHPLRHVITRSLGTVPPPVPDVWIFPVSSEGDTFVACTDGLTNELSEAEISAIVNRAFSPRDAAAALVDAAVSAGGRDNVTAAVVAMASELSYDVEVATAPRGGRA
jgi:protein phosphatase